MLKLQSLSRAEVVAEWLCRYALVFRDAASLPAQITTSTIEAYCEFLADCEPALLNRAMRRCGERARYFPRPQEIRDAYYVLLEAAVGRGARRCDACEGAGYVVDSGKLKRCVRCSRLPGAGAKGENR